MNRRLFLNHPSTLQNLFVCVFVVCASSVAHGEIQADLTAFNGDVQPLLNKYCVGCHGSQEKKGDINLQQIDPDIVKGEHFDQWEDIREAFNSGEMPPEDQSQPSVSERETITHWMDAEFKKAKQHGLTKERGGVRRLTRYELRYALEDLLKVSVTQEINALPDEGTSVETGLKNSSRLLMISGPHLESYLNVVLSVIRRMKDICAYEPYTEKLDIANLDPNPPQAFTRDKRKIKPMVGKVERSGVGVNVNPGGYVDLRIRSISKYKFQTHLTAKADRPGRFQVAIGFTHSEVDPRQKFATLGMIDIDQGADLRRYTLDSFPEQLPTEMTRALDRPFFIRITNRGKQKIYVRNFEYTGNVNADLTETLIPAGIHASDVEAHVQQSIRAFVKKAFRRKPTPSELKRYFGIYRGYATDEVPIAALLSTYKQILCSPNFLYIGLPGELTENAKRNFKLAERLAFFLWCSVPDDLLLKAAADGRLTTPSVLASHVERMLADEKSRRWVEQFTDQWLQTSKLFNVAVDKIYYPRFKGPLKTLMRQETLEAVNDVFRSGAPATELLDADHVFVNQSLAAFYQIKGVRGDEFQKVSVPKELNRGGLLTQGTFLIGNSDGMNSHAILRGVWLSEVILNDPPPDPPKNVPALDESIPGFEKMTLNEKLFAHRNNDACKSCHQKIDPWGIPFENFDASGAWRDKVLVVSRTRVNVDQPGKKRKRKRTVTKKSFAPIDRHATLPDQVEIDGISELKAYLLKHRKQDFAKALTERILAYALSRDIEYHDEDLVNDLVDRFQRNDYSVPGLIRDIAQNEAFVQLPKDVK